MSYLIALIFTSRESVSLHFDPNPQCWKETYLETNYAWYSQAVTLFFTSKQEQKQHNYAVHHLQSTILTWCFYQFQSSHDRKSYFFALRGGTMQKCFKGRWNLGKYCKNMDCEIHSCTITMKEKIKKITWSVVMYCRKKNPFPLSGS